MNRNGTRKTADGQSSLFRFLVVLLSALLSVAVFGCGNLGERRKPPALAVDPDLYPYVSGMLPGPAEVISTDAERAVLEGRADFGLTLNVPRSPDVIAERISSVPMAVAVHFLEPVDGITLSEARSIADSPGAATLNGARLTVVPRRSFLKRGWLREGEATCIVFGESGAGLKLLSVDGVAPTGETVRSGDYRFLEPLYLLARDRRSSAEMSRRLSEALAGAQPPMEPTATLTAVGDIMLARGVGTLIDRYGTGYPLGLVADILSSSDISFANLESPIGVGGSPLPGKLIWFRAKPKTVDCLTGAGIDAVTLANNHTLDYDSENLLETIAILDRAGIAHCGAGRNLTEARKPAIVQRKGITVAFLGYNEFAHPNLFWSLRYPRTLLAGPDVPGTPPIDLTMVAEDIAAARQVADVVVVAYHWGQEYTNHPVPYFGKDLKAIARRTIELGADIVLGFHPHAIQGLEVYRGGLIAYSLGNFVMDQKREITRESMIVRCLISKKGVLATEVIPAMIEDGRPRRLYGDEASRLLAKIRSISASLSDAPR